MADTQGSVANPLTHQEERELDERFENEQTQHAQQDFVPATHNDEDPEWAALEELTRQIEAEDQEGQQQPGQDAAQQPQQQQPTKDQPQTPPKNDQPQQPAPMIPKGRFDEVLTRANELALENARLQGQIEATQKFGQPAGQQQPNADNPPAPTPEQRIASLREKQVDLANKVDEGELTSAQAEVERQKIDDEIWGIRQETLMTQHSQQSPQQGNEPRPDLYLEEKYQQMEQAHPYMAYIEKDSQWAVLADEAKDTLETQLGRALDAKNPADELAWRNRMAELSDVYGPRWTGKTPEEVGLKPPAQQGQQQPSAGQQPQSGLTPEQQARKDKLALQNDLPPNVGDMGKGGRGQDDIWTEERIAGLSDEQYEALPAATRQLIDSRMSDGPIN